MFFLPQQNSSSKSLWDWIKESLSCVPIIIATYKIVYDISQNYSLLWSFIIIGVVEVYVATFLLYIFFSAKKSKSSIIVNPSSSGIQSLPIITQPQYSKGIRMVCLASAIILPIVTFIFGYLYYCDYDKTVCVGLVPLRGDGNIKTSPTSITSKLFSILDNAYGHDHKIINIKDKQEYSTKFFSGNDEATAFADAELKTWGENHKCAFVVHGQVSKESDTTSEVTLSSLPVRDSIRFADFNPYYTNEMRYHVAIMNPENIRCQLKIRTNKNLAQLSHSSMPILYSNAYAIEKREAVDDFYPFELLLSGLMNYEYAHYEEADSNLSELISLNDTMHFMHKSILRIIRGNMRALNNEQLLAYEDWKQVDINDKEIGDGDYRRFFVQIRNKVETESFPEFISDVKVSDDSLYLNTHNPFDTIYHPELIEAEEINNNPTSKDNKNYDSIDKVNAMPNPAGLDISPKSHESISDVELYFMLKSLSLKGKWLLNYANSTHDQILQLYMEASSDEIRLYQGNQCVFRSFVKGGILRGRIDLIPEGGSDSSHSKYHADLLIKLSRPFTKLRGMLSDYSIDYKDPEKNITRRGFEDSGADIILELQDK